MFYYNLELDDESKELATIATPYGKFQHCRMAMGLKPAPDVAQSIIEKILHGLDVETYIDDIGAFDADFDCHLSHLDKVLHRLEENGLKVNPLKCEWCVQETDFPGHWLTPTGVKPWKKKVEAILRMQSPQNATQLCSFLGAATHCRNMWPRRSHLLAPLAELTGKSQFCWSGACQKAFEEMKAVIAVEVLMAYPNHNLPFHVHTNASDYQMGAAVVQDGKPVACWSKKLSAAQRNYSTMEKELLAVIMCFKEFRTMLLGADIAVHTDHKNLTFRTLNTQHVLCWHLFLEDFAPTFKHVEGKDKVLADCFSRLPRMDLPSEGKSLGPSGKHKGKIIHFEKLDSSELSKAEEEEDLELGACRFKCCRAPVNPSDESHAFSSLLDEPELFECFLNYPTLDEMPNPTKMLRIQQFQFEDQQLNQQRQQNPQQFVVKIVNQCPLTCCRLHLNDPPGVWKICVPTALLPDMLTWCHHVLGHCGVVCLYESTRTHMHHPALRRHCDEFVCDTCQRFKHLSPGYGELPECQAPLALWSEAAVDLIGPWKMPIQDQEIEFSALTCIDTVAGLTELTRIDNKTSQHMTNKFRNLWLARCPRPNRCIHDNGGEFIGWEFQMSLNQAGVEDALTTSRNPAANSICERMHQTVAVQVEL